MIGTLAIWVSWVWIVLSFGWLILDSRWSALDQTPSAESFDGSHSCGAVSVAVVVRLLGRRISLVESTELVAVNAFYQSSMKELITGLEQTDFHAKGVRISAVQLQSLNCPVILHLENNHFVACVPLGDGSVIWVDPPNPPVICRTLDRWDGAAIIVARSQSDLQTNLSRIGLSEGDVR